MPELPLAILALLGNCGWFISGRKHRQEVRKAKAEAEKAELDLSVQYVKEFKTNIYAPSTKKCKSCAKPSKPWALATIVTIALLSTSCTTMQTPVGTETIINDGDTIAVVLQHNTKSS